MRIFFKHGDGLASMDVENPTGDYIEWSSVLQEKFESFVKPFFNEDLTDIIENATPEEIAEATKPKVPETVHRMGLKLQLLEKGVKITDIIETINSIPNSMFPDIEKQKALIQFEEAAYFDRYNADLQLVATLMGLSQEDLDDIFINGNKV